MPKKFSIGDRVCQTEKARGRFAKAIWPRTHGIVVFYHHTQHDPRNPRIRWADGWGTTVAASQLRPLTPAEASQWPTPTLVACDQPKP